MRPSSKLVWVRLKFRANGLEFEEALIRPWEGDPADFQLVVEHRFLGSFALHEEFFLERRESGLASWRKVSLLELKLAFLEASRNDGGVTKKEDNRWEVSSIDAGANHGSIPRIPVEGDAGHFDRAKEAFEGGEVRYQIVGGKGSHGKIWGHATFVVDSLPRARALLCSAGFIPSSDSQQVFDRLQKWLEGAPSRAELRQSERVPQRELRAYGGNGGPDLIRDLLRAQHSDPSSDSPRSLRNLA